MCKRKRENKQSGRSSFENFEKITSNDCGKLAERRGVSEYKMKNALQETSTLKIKLKFNESKEKTQRGK